MLKTPVFKKHLHVEVISDEGVLILSEAKALHGRAYEKITPLIDGKRSSDEIVDALAGDVDAARVYFALGVLEKCEFIVESTPETLQERTQSLSENTHGATSFGQLAATAFWVAAARAEESLRNDHLFNDPWADVLAGDIGKAWLDKYNVTNSIAIRTRVFDDFLLEMTGEQQIQQVVILAAGLDTRSFRLPWPDGTRVFEVDQPEVMTFKESVLDAVSAQCQRKAIGIDLRDSWQNALLDSGFNPQQPSVWLLEGLLVYLSEDVVCSLLSSVAALAAKGSRLACDMVSKDMLASPLTRPFIHFLSAAKVPWRFGTDDPETLFLSCNWDGTRTHTFDELFEACGRQRPTLRAFGSDLEFPESFIVTAHKVADDDHCMA